AEVAAPLEVARAMVADLSGYAGWLSMHAAFRESPPSVASEGDTFDQQVLLMGIPADIAWRVAAADEGMVLLEGTGPMDLVLGMRVEALDVDGTTTLRIATG